MLRAILVRQGIIELEDTPLPEPIKGEVLIRVKTAMTCGTDLKAYLRGHKLIPMPGPFGHEYAGEVVAVGEDVNNFKIGDEVMGVHSAPCMSCDYCKRGFFNLCENIMSTKVLGSYAEFLLLPAHIVNLNLYHKPENISFEEAALLEPFSCVVHPYRGIDLEKAQNALVIGSGAIGLMHSVFLKSHGLMVTVMDMNRDRLSIAKKMGVDLTVSPEEIDDTLRKVCGGIGFDLVVECTGQVRVWESAVGYVRRGGTVLLFGGCPSGSKVTYLTNRLHYDELTIKGSFHYTPDDVRYARDLLISKKLNLMPLVTGSFSLQDIKEVFRLLSEGKGIKYAIIPDSTLK
jgi:L-iditol 2-dehydrogenase